MNDRTKPSVALMLITWEDRYGLSQAESAILGEAALYDHTHVTIAQKREVMESTIKSQVQHLLTKTGDRSLGHAALRLLREFLDKADAA